ncbi:unnamed protein product (macronuclear) [Paramecium tetraurelia]|uniref:Protein kinase domain-containing protein n=1 Tax=Paramecium tetraurelia TaxID=5888 RepID=A0CPV2_PARTE|nr:uncharacterized protein GSPATT00009211001 [Paramecium tetraurelia]CAK72819.1 unnamed protein product [Paramecium tetraurelia]|eukprot:XP_001440216.1 hypothetical protein (macronuclear) [Paramecium tetraurelia strain d4-2]
MGTVDLETLDRNIKVTIEIEISNLQKLERQLRGKVLYKRRPCFKRINGIANYVCIRLLSYQFYYRSKEPITTQLRRWHSFRMFLKTPQIQLDLYIKLQQKQEQIKQEQMILNNLRDHPHPDIIQLEEISCDENSISVLLEYCPGGDLLKFLNQNNQNINHQLVMKKLLNVVQHIHYYDILHRDIKLQNVLFRKANDASSLVLADFGLACLKSQLLNNNNRCGTPGYTAPEVFTQAIYDQKVDIFSCGVVFFNLLTLKNPFGSSKNPQTLLLKNIAADYDLTYLDQIKSKNPKACDLVIQMLKKDPKQRPSATQCLQHPFFSQEVVEQKEDSTFDNIQFNNPIHQTVKVSQTKPHQMPQFK